MGMCNDLLSMEVIIHTAYSHTSDLVDVAKICVFDRDI